MAFSPSRMTELWGPEIANTPQRVLGTVMGHTSPNQNSNSYTETLHSTIKLHWTLWERMHLFQKVLCTVVWRIITVLPQILTHLGTPYIPRYRYIGPFVITQSEKVKLAASAVPQVIIHSSLIAASVGIYIMQAS